MAASKTFTRSHHRYLTNHITNGNTPIIFDFERLESYIWKVATKHRTLIQTDLNQIIEKSSPVKCGTTSSLPGIRALGSRYEVFGKLGFASICGFLDSWVAIADWRLGHPADQVFDVLQKELQVSITFTCFTTRDPFPFSDHTTSAIGDLI
ncbi:hypothetical protein Tco_1163280 [Tanacetum coccineum]